LAGHPRLAQPLLHRAVAEQVVLLRPAGDPVDALAAADVSPRPDPLPGERGADQLPSLSLLAEPAGDGDARVGEEHLAAGGLADPLAPDDVTGGDAAQVVALLLLGAVGHDGGADPVDVHVLGPARLAVRPELLGEHGHPPGAGLVAAVLARPVRSQPAALGEL